MEKKSYFIISKEEILSELLRSRENGLVVGVFSELLGPGMFLCNVKDVWRDEDEDDVIILLNENVLTGGRPDAHVLFLHEIDRIYPFSVWNSYPSSSSMLSLLHRMD